MNEIPPAPGCPTCDATWFRRATVFDQYGFGATEGMLYYRCIACDTRWCATTDHRYPLQPGTPMPNGRTAPTATDLGPALVPGPPPPSPPVSDAMPAAIRVGPLAQRSFAGPRIVVPFAEQLTGSWVGTPLQSHVAVLAALTLVLDAVLPDVDVRTGGSYLFHARQYTDAIGAVHVGYGLQLPFALTRTMLAAAVVAPERPSLAYPPNPIEVELDGDRVRRLGPGVHAPVTGAFNAVEFVAPTTALPESEPAPGGVSLPGTQANGGPVPAFR